MKVIFSHPQPFFIAHGGSQTLIEELMRGLAGVGVEVEPERWWDERQTGDIIHYVGRPLTINVRLAQKKGFKTVLTDLLDTTANRSRRKLMMQRTAIKIIRRLAPGMIDRVGWEVYQEIDALVFPVSHEFVVAKYLFDAAPDRGQIIPWGMPTDALTALAQPQAEQDYLISIATIAPRKNSVALARAARDAKVPVVFTGKPFSDQDAYFREFASLVDGKFVRFAGFVSEMEKRNLLRGARGFVLFSQAESGCIAAYEAAAAGLPLLLSDAPWARFGYPGADPIRFVPLGSHDVAVNALRDFYATAHRMNRTTFPILTWEQVGQRYVAIYERLLAARS
jgi:glycosyltransferase involved in cell wall biosynthesis